MLCVVFTPSKPRTTHPDTVCVLHTRFHTLDANSIHCMFMLGNLHFLGRITASHEHDLGTWLGSILLRLPVTCYWYHTAHAASDTDTDTDTTHCHATYASPNTCNLTPPRTDTT